MAMVPKKSLALQVRRQPSAGVMPVLGESGASVTASLASLVPHTVVPVPMVVVVQPVMEVIPLLTSEWAELSAAPIVSTTMGVAQPDEVPPIEAKVMVATIDGS